MSRDFFRFELLHLQVWRLVILLFFVAAVVASAALYVFDAISSDIARIIVVSGAGLSLIYLFFCSRYKVFGNVIFYSDHIDIVNTKTGESLCFEMKDVKNVKLKIDGVYYSGTPAGPIIKYYFKDPPSRKAISRLHLETVAGERISVSMRARSMNYALAEQILEGYKAAGVEVKYVIYKNT